MLSESLFYKLKRRNSLGFSKDSLLTSQFHVEREPGLRKQDSWAWYANQHFLHLDLPPHLEQVNKPTRLLWEDVNEIGPALLTLWCVIWGKHRGRSCLVFKKWLLPLYWWDLARLMFSSGMVFHYPFALIVFKYINWMAMGFFILRQLNSLDRS